MDGIMANLPEIKKLAVTYNSLLLVDDSHGLGTCGKTGKGALEYWNMEGQVDIVTGTCGKSLSSIGGYVATTKNLADYIKYSRGGTFSCQIPPFSAATALEALKV